MLVENLEREESLRFERWQPSICETTECNIQLFHRSTAYDTRIVENAIEKLGVPVEVYCAGMGVPVLKMTTSERRSF